MSKKTRSILFLSLVVPVLIVAGFICFDKDDRDREMICRLFHVQPEAIADVTVNVINRHTGKTPSRFTIPNQDSDYYVEGCYRLPRQALAPYRVSLTYRRTINNTPENPSVIGGKTMTSNRAFWKYRSPEMCYSLPKPVGCTLSWTFKHLRGILFF